MSIKGSKIIHMNDDPYVDKKCPSAKSSNKSDEKSFKCSVCEKDFVKQSSLTRHQRIHLEDKPYKCEQCEKVFKRLDYLNKHQKIHSSVKSYKCDKCLKMFASKYSLKKHEMTHTTKKSYKCEECHKCFKQLNYLKGHKTVHSGEKPLECEQCQKTFSRLCNLKQHQKTHSDEKLYECTKCQECFSNFNHLKDHRMTQCGQNPLKCKDCLQIFHSRCNLYKHAKKFHSGKKLPENSHNANLSPNYYPGDNDLSLLDVESLNEKLNQKYREHNQNEESEISLNTGIQQSNVCKRDRIHDNENKSKNVDFANDLNLQTPNFQKEFIKCYLCSYESNNDLGLGLHYLSHL